MEKTKILPITQYQERNGNVTFKNVKYRQILYVQNIYDGKPNGIYSSAKAHFFNEKGVLVGHDYKFVPYNLLAKHDKGDVWERIYMGKKFEKLRHWIFKQKCLFITKLIKHTQKDN